VSVTLLIVKMEGEKKEEERKKVRKREWKRRKRIQLLILFGIKVPFVSL
jgi:hypothetical protein